jgi:uncharacterized protein YbjT (DUF2867 family)
VHTGRDSLFCDDLPTRPDPAAGRILVTGASGYIGGRLVPELLGRGYTVRVMVRGQSASYHERWAGAEIVTGDALEIRSLLGALRGATSAYYLIHSMLLGPERFAAIDIQAAANFRRAAEDAGLRRIVYLGGLGDVAAPLSPHLRSRIEVAEELQRGRVPVTILRAAVIIGSGSASYEIIKNLVKKVPLILVPHCARSLCQPIAIRDVIKYLVGVIEVPETAGRAFDIGGSDILSYRDMMKSMAEVLQIRRLFVPLPYFPCRLYAHLSSLLTPVPSSIAQCLLEGLRNDVVCKETAIRDLIPFVPVGYRESVVRALSREEQDRVHTRWSDAYPPAHVLAIKLQEADPPPRYTASYSLMSDKGACVIFRSVCRIGGEHGWFHSNWMWRLRGLVDRMLLGVGSSRGRKTQRCPQVNDVIGFWRVEDVKEEELLLLRAEMKLPGRAWLEFRIEEVNGRRRLAVAAFYDTGSIWGRLYWYTFLPFHRYIFKGLIEEIEVRAGT